MTNVSNTRSFTGILNDYVPPVQKHTTYYNKTHTECVHIKRNIRYRRRLKSLHSLVIYNGNHYTITMNTIFTAAKNDKTRYIDIMNRITPK